MWRAVLFAAVGAALFVHWVLADPGFDASESQDEWPSVLLFSAAVAGLAVGLPVFARLVGGTGLFRASLVAASGALVSSVANIVEDGLHQEWAFWVFVLGSAVLLAGLLAMAVLLLRRGCVPARLPAIVPLGTAAGLVLYVVAGGPIMLGTWLAAAAFALARRTPGEAGVPPTGLEPVPPP